MSVLIKGMDMPKNCDECSFSEWTTNKLYSNNKLCHLETTIDCIFDLSNCPFDGRHKECPLVEVQASPFDKKDELESLERIRSGGGLLPLVDIDMED